jgi:hypothetical protein
VHYASKQALKRDVLPGNMVVNGPVCIDEFESCKEKNKKGTTKTMS